MEIKPLLSQESLVNVRLGLSASPSPDLDRLGLLERHFRLAFGELGRTMLALGGKLQYCGHLEPGGYTPFLISELYRYGSKIESLSILLAWSVHRQLTISELNKAKSELSLYGTLECLDNDGNPIDCVQNRTEQASPVEREQVQSSLSAMRRTAAARVQARVFIGGRRVGYQGVLPGVLEEAILAIESGQPSYFAGGFGGVTLDIIRRISPQAALWYPNVGEAVSDSVAQGLEVIRNRAADHGWEALRNGLSDAENVLLSISHRPSEIASLVGLGMGRLANQGNFYR